LDFRDLAAAGLGPEIIPSSEPADVFLPRVLGQSQVLLDVGLPQALKIHSEDHVGRFTLFEAIDEAR